MSRLMAWTRHSDWLRSDRRIPRGHLVDVLPLVREKCRRNLYRVWNCRCGGICSPGVPLRRQILELAQSVLVAVILATETLPAQGSNTGPRTTEGGSSLGNQRP